MDIKIAFIQLMQQCFRVLTYEFHFGIYTVTIWELSLCMESFILFMNFIGRMFGKQEMT